MSWEPNPFKVVVMSMMTNIQTVTKKILQPLALAIAMLFLTPVVGLLNTALKAPLSVQLTSNETVVYKTTQSSVAFKG
jgi:hypothetical protein